MIKLPKPVSGGIILSYQCNLSCIHCMYNCRKNWKGWISIEIFEKYIKKLKDVNSFISLHLTGGEPFLNFPLLKECTKICKEYNIPFFVETNCYWAKNDEIAENLLLQLKKCGLNSIMLSYSIFYVNKVPLKNFEIAMKKSFEIFGQENVSFYTFSGYKLLKEANIEQKVTFSEALQKIGNKKFVDFLKDYIVPKGKCLYNLDEWFQKFPPEKFKGANCLLEFLNPYHIHIDLYGNYIPSFCSGISLGNIEEIFKNWVVNPDKILNFLITDIYSFLLWAENLGYKRSSKGYINKCHLCLDIRKFLIENGMVFDSLKPVEFYSEI